MKIGALAAAFFIMALHVHAADLSDAPIDSFSGNWTVRRLDDPAGHSRFPAPRRYRYRLHLNRSIDRGISYAAAHRLVALIYGTIKGKRAYHGVFDTREQAMEAAEDWFKGLDVGPWD